MFSLGLALALRKANFLSRNIGLLVINQPFAVVPANTAAKHTALTNFANIREPDFARTNFCDCKKN